MNPSRASLLLALSIFNTVLPGCGDESLSPSTATKEDVSTNTASAPWFKDTIETSGIDFIHDSGSNGLFRIPEIMCGGVALLDVDDDGDLDAYLVQSGPSADPSVPGGPNQLYLNHGDGTFQNVTSDRGDVGDARYGIGVTTADYDLDGDLDLFVTNLGRNTLLQNDGSGHFTDVTSAAGLLDEEFSASATFFDADGDNDLDLYVCNYLVWSPDTEIECKNTLGQPDYCAPMAYSAPAADRLYRNEGNGTFQDISEIAGITSAPGTGLGVAAADFDQDGRNDLFVANDGMPDRLWMNQGGGVFKDLALISGCAMDSSGKAKAGMGVCIEDVDDNGYMDILVCNLWRETDSLFINDGKGRFTDITTRAGLAGTPKTYTRFGIGLHDFNHDGHLDLFEANGRVANLATRHGDASPYDEPNLVFRGSNTRFIEVKPRGATTTPLYATSRGAAFGDINGDGATDVVVINRDAPPHVLMNVSPKEGHWLRVEPLDQSGGPAIGAIIKVTHGDRTLTRQIRTDGSYLSANDPRAHFGLHPGAISTTVSVQWPDGNTLTLDQVELNRALLLPHPESNRMPNTP